jgi:hypothetical protein
MIRAALKGLLLAFVIVMVAAQPALAYIDPNTGGMLFQLLAVAFASLSAIVLIFSRQIRTFFARVSRALRGNSERRSEPAAASVATESDRSQQSGGSSEPLD